MNNNIILKTDSYKLNHWNQYPEGTEGVYSYFEARNGATFPYTVFFGLQYILIKHLVGTVVTRQKIEEAEILARAHFGSDKLFNRKGWEHILTEHNGRLPVRIKAVREGSKIPNNNVLMTVENTDPECYWLTNALETVLTQVWYPSTVATLSTTTIKMIEGFIEETGGDPAMVIYSLHDFGGRGVTGVEAAELGGAAHLITSRGTDTLPGMTFAMEHYGADLKDLAFSVPATEHSVMTALGDKGELTIVQQLLDNYPDGILSVVADSYNIYEFVDSLEGFKDQIIKRDGKFVVRPDSVTARDKTPEELMVRLSDRLWDLFGGRTNDKDYRVLNPHVGLLWGDGIDPEGIMKILTACQKAGFAAENYVFGMGGGLLQKINRDTQRFAFKCSAQKRNGEWHDVYKRPLDESKASKRGRLALTYAKSVGYYETIQTGGGNLAADLLEPVFEDGALLRYQTFKEVRDA